MVGGSSSYELVSAARWAGFRHFGEFDELESDDQARIVAEYRVAQRRDAVLAGLRETKGKRGFRPKQRR